MEIKIGRIELASAKILEFIRDSDVNGIGDLMKLRGRNQVSDEETSCDYVDVIVKSSGLVTLSYNEPVGKFKRSSLLNPLRIDLREKNGVRYSRFIVRTASFVQGYVCKGVSHVDGNMIWVKSIEGRGLDAVREELTSLSGPYASCIHLPLD